MPCSARHKDGVPRPNAALEVQAFPAISHADKPLAFFYTDELIRVRVHFFSNLSKGWNTHQGHLYVIPCPKRCAKILILHRKDFAI